jgi:hypothetical protein
MPQETIAEMLEHMKTTVDAEVAKATRTALSSVPPLAHSDLSAEDQETADLLKRPPVTSDLKQFSTPVGQDRMPGGNAETPVTNLPNVAVEPPLAEKVTFVPPITLPVDRVIPSDASSMNWTDAQACIARGQSVARPGWHWGSTTLSQADLEATDWRVVG